MKEQKPAPNKKLLWERESRGWTQQRALEAIQLAGGDISLRTLRRAENGEPVSLHTISALTKFYGKTAEELGLLGECPLERRTNPQLSPEQYREWDQEAASLDASLPLAHHLPCSQPTTSTVSQSNRQIFLGRVSATWIEGVLEHSLHHAALIALGLHEQPEMVANPWRLSVQECHVPARPVPPGTRITQVYDEADGELLILGEPGAGKTTLLLELARELLARAEQESSHLMPVVLNLSSWAVKRQPLAVWLVEELNAKYQVPRRVGQVWIDADQILPLLDGLDEVAQAHRSACVDTINAYRHEHGLVPMVICSRRVEYVAQETQVLLHRAVMVQPLTKQQIDEYLSNIGEPLAGLQTALRHDPTLQELTTTPFMLNVLVLTYQDVPVEDLVQEACLPDRQAKIFEHYVARMLRHRGAERRYTPEQTTRWLSWLARQLRRHNETEFYLEHLQRDWLPKPQERIYQFCLGLVFGGTVGLFVTLIYMAAYLFDWTIGGWFGKVAVPAFLGVFAAVVLLLLYGVLFPWLDTGEPWSNPATLSNSSWRISRLRLATLFKNRIFYGLSIGLLHGWFLSYYNIWLPYVVLNGLVFGIGYALVGRVDGSIHPAEIVGWSWRSRQKQLIGGLLIGLLFGLASNPHQLFIYALYYKAIPHSYLFDRSEITYILLIGATTGLGIGIIFALISCISNETLEKNKHVRPNQGIHRSVRNSIFLGLVSGIFAGLLTALILGPIESWILSYSLSTFSFNNSPYQTYSPIGVCWGIAVGIAVAVVVALRNGGVACLQHALLRLLLWHAGSIPWNYPRFLDYTVERIFLRRIGGGYIFVHRLLLEYFASLDSIPPLKEAKVQKQLAEPTP